MQTMQVLRSIMADPYFTMRTSAFTNGTFLGEEYVRYSAINLGADMSKTYGVASMLFPDHVLGLFFWDKPEEGYITVSRHFSSDVTADESMKLLHLKGNGYVALHEGAHDAIKALLAGISEASNDRIETKDCPLLN